jgi:hypothetical protein
MITCNVLDYIVIMRITLSTSNADGSYERSYVSLCSIAKPPTGYWSFLPGFHLLSFSPLWRTVGAVPFIPTQLSPTRLTICFISGFMGSAVFYRQKHRQKISLERD